ncbi:hypothetical protein Ndes2526B_g03956 [Nannochloris sp. 'desiccata']
MKALFGSGNAAAGFEHVIAAETAKATEMAAKAEAQKLDDELGYNAPAVEAPGKDCVAWIKQFMGDKMQQRSDGQWEFLVEGFTKTKSGPDLLSDEKRFGEIIGWPTCLLFNKANNSAQKCFWESSKEMMPRPKCRREGLVKYGVI